MLFIIITSKNKGGTLGLILVAIKCMVAAFFVVLAIVTFQDWWFIVAFGLAGGLSFTIGWLIYDEYKRRKENKRLAAEWKERKSRPVEYEINNAVIKKTLPERQKPLITGTINWIDGSSGKETTLIDISVDIKNK